MTFANPPAGRQTATASRPPSRGGAAAGGEPPASCPDAGGAPFAGAFDARRIRLKLIAGSASGDERAVALAFYPETMAEARALYAALEEMRRIGEIAILTAPLKETA